MKLAVFIAILLVEIMVVTSFRVYKIEKDWTNGDDDEDEDLLKLAIHYEAATQESVEFYLDTLYIDASIPVDQSSTRDSDGGTATLQLHVPDSSRIWNTQVEFFVDDIYTLMYIPTRENNPGHSVITTEGVRWLQKPDRVIKVNQGQPEVHLTWVVESDIKLLAYIRAFKIVRLGNGGIKQELLYGLTKSDQRRTNSSLKQEREFDGDICRHTIEFTIDTPTAEDPPLLYTLSLWGFRQFEGVEIEAQFEIIPETETSLLTSNVLGVTYMTSSDPVIARNDTYSLAEVNMMHYMVETHLLMIECKGLGATHMELYANDILLSPDSEGRLVTKRLSPYEMTLQYTREVRKEDTEDTVYTCRASNGVRSVDFVYEFRYLIL